MDLGLKGVHVLVTGASGGIGLVTARLFLEQDARVTAQYNSNDSALRALVEEYGDQINTVKCNFADEHAAETWFPNMTTDSGFGPVSILIVNHAIYKTQDVPLVDMSAEQWRHTMDSNLTSSFLVTREYMRQLRSAPENVKDHASIIFIGSTAGSFGEAGHADYAASKSAMMYGLTATLKNEIVKIAPAGRVNCIAPGWVKTPMAAEALSDAAYMAKVLATTPLRKVATPDDVASQVVFTSSVKRAGHVNGQIIMIHGGMEGRVLNDPTPS